jgi:acetyl esterase/lipase
MKIQNTFLSLLILTFSIHNVYAQTIRERIAVRLAHRQQADEMDQEDGDIKPFNPENATVQRNISYGADNAQSFDVYIPKNAQNASVILMVHGGAWRTGDKAMSSVVENKANRWLAKGIIFVSINYRMLPKADPLTQANDVALALAKAQSLAPSWGGDSKRFVIIGHSAGAHLVALISANPSLAKQQGAQPWLGTVMLDSAAYDIEKTMSSKHLPLYDKAFGNDNAFWKNTSPSVQLTQKTVPLLAVCSTKRKDQPCTQASAFIDNAAKFGSQANVLPEALSHREINENLGLPSKYTKKVEAFMRALGLPL